MFLSLLSGCALLGCCLGLANIKRWPKEITPLLSISIIISVLYICAYLDFLRIATYLIFSLGLLFLVLSPLYFKLNRQKENLFFIYLTPGFVFWLLLTFIFSFYAAQSWLHTRDEFLVWGPHAEAVFLNNGLINATDFGGHKSYPLGAALFYYLFIFFRNFSDGSLYFAQNILLISPLVLIFSSAKWSQWRVVLSGFIFIIFYMIIAGNMHIGYKIWLIPDEAIGLFFGGILLIYYQSKKEIKDLLYLLPIVFAFMLLKPKLLSFVLLLTFIIMIDQIYQHLLDKKQREQSKIRFYLLWRLLVTFSLLAVALIAALTWQHYLNKTGLKNDFLNPTINNLLQLFSGQLNPLQQKIVALYLQRIGKIIITFIPIFILIPIAWLLMKSKVQRYQFALWQIMLFIGFILYSFGLLLINLFSFSQDMNHIPITSVQIAILRFLRIYFLGWSLLLLGIIFHVLQPWLKNISNKIQNVLLISSLIAMAGLLLYWVWQIHNQNLMKSAFMYLKSLASFTVQNTKPTDHICIITQGLSWDHLAQLEYELIPRKVSQYQSIKVNDGCNYVLLINKNSLK